MDWYRVKVEVKRLVERLVLIIEVRNEKGWGGDKDLKDVKGRFGD